MKKIGIICEGYKVDMFKQELDAAGVSYVVENEEYGPLRPITCISEQYIVGPITDKVTQYWIDYYKKSNK